MKIEREQVPRTQLVPKLLQDAAARSLPDLVLADNPDLQQLASTGGLVSLSANGLSTTGLYPSIVAAGSYQGQTYGIAPGVNDLALYYNKDLFTKAGLTAPTTWAELTADAKALTSGARKGIAFSAAATEEGSFQFEPFFWSAGANLSNLDSSQAVQALTLWKTLVSDGYASKSVVNWSQSDVEAQFQAGNAAMMVNGPGSSRSSTPRRGSTSASSRSRCPRPRTRRSRRSAARYGRSGGATRPGRRRPSRWSSAC